MTKQDRFVARAAREVMILLDVPPALKENWRLRQKVEATIKAEFDEYQEKIQETRLHPGKDE